MYLERIYLLKIIVLTNALSNGWIIKYYNDKTFYLVKIDK